MQRYVARRLAQALLVIVGISAVAFALTHVIGDPVVLLLPFQASPAQVAVMRHALGLDQPLFVQYLTFLRASLHGDLGISIRQETPALALVLDRVPATAELASAALVIAVATLLFSGWSLWMNAVDARSTNPFPSEHRDAQIVLEFLLPSLVGLTVLWRMLVRSHRIAAGLDPRTRWPWFTMCVSLALVFNPVGIELVGSAIAPSGSDWLAGLWRIVRSTR